MPLIAMLLAGCGQGGPPPPETVVDDGRLQDSNSLVSFELPAGWAEVRASNGTRFSAPGADAQRVRMQVSTVTGAAGRSLEKERDGWLEAQASLGLEILGSGPFELEGFEGVEYSQTVENTMGPAIWHFVTLKRDDYLVTTWLQAAPDRYQQYLPVYLDVVRSLRPLSAPPP